MVDVNADERLNKINRVVFNRNNIEEIRDVLHNVLDVFMTIVERPFEHGNCFTYKDILDRMVKVDQNEWRNMSSKYLKDPYHDYCKGDFTDQENKDPAKILLDLINLLSVAQSSVYNRLQEYESVFRNLKDEKRSINEKLHATETKLMEEVQSHSMEHIELKTAQGKLAYYENLIEEKNMKIAQLQRNNTIELWEREKKKALQNSDAKLVEVMDELEEVKQMNTSHFKKMQILEEQNRIMKMKQELSNKPSGLAASAALEDIKRKNFLLEKDVMCLEDGMNTLQKLYIAVLGGIRTDLHIATEKYRSPETNELTDEDLEQLDNRIAFVYDKAKNAELEKSKSDMLPHYQYVPQDVKVKKIRRISLCKISEEKEEQPKTSMSRRRIFMQSKKKASEKETSSTDNKTIGTHESIEKEEKLENPQLLDSSGFNLNIDLCRKHFPHMSADLLKNQWDQFKEYDSNGDRSLDFTEVVAALKGMGMQFSAMEAEEAMREIDVDRSQTLDFYEYLLVTDKITRQTGRSRLFKSGIVKTHTNVVAKTCSIQ